MPVFYQLIEEETTFKPRKNPLAGIISRTCRSYDEQVMLNILYIVVFVKH